MYAHYWMLQKTSTYVKMTRHACYDKTDINVRKEKQYVQDKKKYGTCKKGNENGNAICIAMSAAIFQLIALAGSPCKYQRYFVTASWDKANLKEKTREKKVGRERSAQEDETAERKDGQRRETQRKERLLAPMVLHIHRKSVHWFCGPMSFTSWLCCFSDKRTMVGSTIIANDCAFSFSSLKRMLLLPLSWFFFSFLIMPMLSLRAIYA